jgi:hypothetical protein
VSVSEVGHADDRSRLHGVARALGISEPISTFLSGIGNEAVFSSLSLLAFRCCSSSGSDATVGQVSATTLPATFPRRNVPVPRPVWISRRCRGLPGSRATCPRSRLHRRPRHREGPTGQRAPGRAAHSSSPSCADQTGKDDFAASSWDPSELSPHRE